MAATKPPWPSLIVLFLSAAAWPGTDVSACDGDHDGNSGVGYRPLGGEQIEGSSDNFRSVLGDGGMRDERVRVALESWNFCNRVGVEGGSGMPSPRLADCARLVCDSYLQEEKTGLCTAEQLVKKTDNELKSGMAFPQGDFVDSTNADDYAVQKELYLGSLCQTESDMGMWHFWMIMLKNGNLDLSSGMCPSTAPAPSKSSQASKSLESQGRKHVGTGKSSPRKVAQLSEVSSFSHQESNNKSSTLHSSIAQLADISADTKKGSRTPPFLASSKSSFPCFGHGCMNHPRVFHDFSTVQALKCANASNVQCKAEQAPSLSGRFYGTYDLNDGLTNQSIKPSSSYFQVDWSKNPQSGSWLFHHVLRVNQQYPWLMLYLRADATKGLSGGYPWDTRGMMIKVPESPNFIVKLTLEVLQGGGSASQFYLLDIGGCWKNDGSQCDGDTSTDVTRYSEMIINPSTDSWCTSKNLALCPPYHVDSKTKELVHRNDTARFPYSAYHYYCVPPNAQFAEKPHSVCDPYSNPQPQELMQLMPHPEWAVHGYPSAKGQGWIGDPRTWTLDVGGLSDRLYFYQDPNTTRSPRKWTSVDVGTEIYISKQMETAEWIVSDFDVLIKGG